jgi:hypothetical protein
MLYTFLFIFLFISTPAHAGNFIGGLFGGNTFLGDVIYEGEVIFGAGTIDDPAIQLINPEVGIWRNTDEMRFHIDATLSNEGYTFNFGGSKYFTIQPDYNGAVAHNEISNDGYHISSARSDIDVGIGWSHTIFQRDSIIGSRAAGVVTLSGLETEEQTFEIYELETDATNYERLSITAVPISGAYHINTEADGVGTRKNLLLTDLYEFDPTGVMSIGTTSGGDLRIKSVSEVHVLAAATSSDTSLAIPAGALILGAQFNVDGAVTGPTDWDADFITGSTTNLADEEAVALNTKVDTLIAPEVTTSVTEVRFSADGVAFTGGTIEVVVRYIDLSSISDA